MGAPVTLEDRALVDDGVGGAVRGTGLRGLEDWVAAQGGDFTITSLTGDDTSVRAQLPC